MSGGEALIPLITSVAFFVTLSGYIYYRSRENMALIDKGINPRQNKALPKPFGSLKYGLLLVGAGVGLAVAFLLDLNMKHKTVQFGSSTIEEGFEALYFAFIAIGGGVGLVISYVAERKAWETIHKKDAAIEAAP